MVVDSVVAEVVAVALAAVAAMQLGLGSDEIEIGAVGASRAAAAAGGIRRARVACNAHSNQVRCRW